MKRQTIEPLWFFLLSSLVLCAPCGIKGPPVAPEGPVPPPVNDLKVEAIGGELALTWSLPKEDEGVFAGLEQIRIYRHRSKRSAQWCPDCPIAFKPFLDIKITDPWPARREGDRMIFRDTIGADDRYAYKVVVRHSSGAESKDSNIVFWPEVRTTQ